MAISLRCFEPYCIGTLLGELRNYIKKAADSKILFLSAKIGGSVENFI